MASPASYGWNSFGDKHAPNDHALLTYKMQDLQRSSDNPHASGLQSNELFTISEEFI